MGTDALFSGWGGVVRVVVVGTLAYVALIALLRVSGKRTLSKLNAFDLIVTVALGSTLATVLLSRDVAFVEGLAAFTLLIGLQLLITWLSVRSRLVGGLVKAAPTLLAFRGRLLDAAMRRERVTPDEVLAAARASGIGRIEDLHAAVLETDGGVSVIGRSGAPPPDALDGVGGPAPDA